MDESISSLRFAVLAALLFAVTFGGVIWGLRGFPMMTARAVPAPGPEIRTGTPEPPSAPVPIAEAKPVAPIEPEPRSLTALFSSDPGRQLRQTAIQAANGYALSPCDPTAKAAFIVATSTYAATARDAMDSRVRQAMQMAFGVGGVSADEFPMQVRGFVADLPERGSGCGASRRAEARR